MSNVGIKKYLIISCLVSSGLSVMKYFKYEINFGDPMMNYPISNEWDIFDVDKKQSHAFDDAFFLVNSISDLTNYVVFVLICVSIDVYMVVELRKVMSDKMNKIRALYCNSKAKIESAMKENEDAMNKAIRMVVINTAIGLLFKMPLSFIPLINVYAEFYYKNSHNRYTRPAFNRFYLYLFNNGVYSQVSDLADFLFVVSISIQPLVYKRFDRKIQTAFDRLFNINKTKEPKNN